MIVITVGPNRGFTTFGLLDHVLLVYLYIIEKKIGFMSIE